MSFSLESGIHRVQRVPDTERGGRVHTSIVNVIVLKKEVQNEEVLIDQRLVKISYYKDSGNGGQKRNKTLSGVRLQYLDFIIECCETRDQRKNKELAFERLKEKIKDKNLQIKKVKFSEEMLRQNPNYGKRGNFTRNYNYIRDEVLHDNKKYRLSEILKGNFSIIYAE